jgi:hypothetical protein
VQFGGNVLDEFSPNIKWDLSIVIWLSMEMEGEWTYLNKYRSVLSARMCASIVRGRLFYFVKSKNKVPILLYQLNRLRKIRYMKSFFAFFGYR